MLVLILIVLLFNTIAYSIPKRLTPIEMLTTTLFAMLIQLLTDIYLSLKYNIYGYFEKGLTGIALSIFWEFILRSILFFLIAFRIKRSSGIR